MSKIDVQKDVTHLENRSYKGKIDKAILCKSGKVMLKIALGNEMFFVSFHDAKDIGKFPFNHLFMAVDSDELSDIENLNVEFDIVNNTSKKTGAVFSNIRQIKAVD